MLEWNHHVGRRACCLLLAGSVLAATLPAALTAQGVHKGHGPAARTASDSAAVVGVIADYHRALETGDSTAALALLAPGAVILESGGMETREEYRGHHLPGDIAYARAVPSTRTVKQVTVQGGAAWVSSTSVSQGTYNSRAINSAGAELVVLAKDAGGRWRIAAIHWSARARRTTG